MTIWNLLKVIAPNHRLNVQFISSHLVLWLWRTTEIIFVVQASSRGSCPAPQSAFRHNTAGHRISDQVAFGAARQPIITRITVAQINFDT
jgi:hypothetical protein